MARVLEISRNPLFKFSMPEETTWFGLGTSIVAGDENCVSERFTWRNMLQLLRELRRGTYDLVLLPAVDITYSHDTHWEKRLARRLIQAFAFTKLAAWLGEAVFRWSKNVVVFVDIADSSALSYEVCALVPGFLAYFKRELFPESTLRQEARWRSVNARVLPWSLFVPKMDFVPDATHKTTDVFFAGQYETPVRKRGMPIVRQLESQGYKIDVPTERLDNEKFMQRMADAWLVWSPEGHGWDCYRHYEAAFAGAVPVINVPAQARETPYREGEECFYYRPEGDHLAEVLTGALRDKDRLRAMAARAREVAVGHHTRPALVADMKTAIARLLHASGKSPRLAREWGGVSGPHSA